MLRLVGAFLLALMSPVLGILFYGVDVYSLKMLLPTLMLIVSVLKGFMFWPVIVQTFVNLYLLSRGKAP